MDSIIPNVDAGSCTTYDFLCVYAEIYYCRGSSRRSKGVKKRLNMRVKTMNLDIKKECNNVMVIVPHQDDEILMSAGVIRVCEQNNVPYTVVMVTNGDYGSLPELW